MSPPSFYDVPDSAAPDKTVSSAFARRELDNASRASTDSELETARYLSVSVPFEEEDEEDERVYTRENIMMQKQDSQNGYTNGRDLPALQTQGSIDDFARANLNPMTEDDPGSYDLVAPGDGQDSEESWSLEKQSQALFSKEHLQVIFAEAAFLMKFTSFLGGYRPHSVPILVHYLDSLKALRAIHYTNAILEGLDPVEGMDFTSDKAELTVNKALETRANAAFDHLVKEELPAYITHQYIQIVSASISARISGSLASYLRDASEGLAEVFCLTDPSRPDNPIVFASEEFNRTTQYGMSYILGRNCRFLQGPETNPTSVRRLRDAIKAGKQHQEVFLNYRRDGSPFMNLLMVAPLCDSRGKIRYNIGAQVDVSGLVKDCAEMDSLKRLIELQARGEKAPDHQIPSPEKNDELRELAEMLNQAELSTIRKYGGRMHRELRDDDHHHLYGAHNNNNGTQRDNESVSTSAISQPRLLLRDPTTITPPIGLDPFSSISGRLSGVYQHYLLVRPYPSLRILFASPSQRVPGILQSPFMNKIGGSQRVRDELTAALAEGRGVTAKVRWVSKTDEEGRNRWIHCTPLVGVNQQVGVWMIVLVDDDRPTRRAPGAASAAGGRAAPPVHGHANYGQNNSVAGTSTFYNSSTASTSGGGGGPTAPSPSHPRRDGGPNVDGYGNGRYGNNTGPTPPQRFDRSNNSSKPQSRRGSIDEMVSRGSGSVNSFGLG